VERGGFVVEPGVFSPRGRVSSRRRLGRRSFPCGVPAETRHATSEAARAAGLETQVYLLLHPNVIEVPSNGCIACAETSLANKLVTDFQDGSFAGTTPEQRTVPAD
jgi:hypothetical protein